MSCFPVPGAVLTLLLPPQNVGLSLRKLIGSVDEILPVLPAASRTEVGTRGAGRRERGRASPNPFYLPWPDRGHPEAAQQGLGRPHQQDAPGAAERRHLAERGVQAADADGLPHPGRGRQEPPGRRGPSQAPGQPGEAVLGVRDGAERGKEKGWGRRGGEAAPRAGRRRREESIAEELAFVCLPVPPPPAAARVFSIISSVV